MFDFLNTNTVISMWITFHKHWAIHKQCLETSISRYFISFNPVCRQKSRKSPERLISSFEDTLPLKLHWKIQEKEIGPLQHKIVLGCTNVQENSLGSKRRRIWVISTVFGHQCCLLLGMLARMPIKTLWCLPAQDSDLITQTLVEIQ